MCSCFDFFQHMPLHINISALAVNASCQCYLPQSRLFVDLDPSCEGRGE